MALKFWPLSNRWGDHTAYYLTEGLPARPATAVSRLLLCRTFVVGDITIESAYYFGGQLLSSQKDGDISPRLGNGAFRWLVVVPNPF